MRPWISLDQRGIGGPSSTRRNWTHVGGRAGPRIAGSQKYFRIIKGCPDQGRTEDLSPRRIRLPFACPGNQFFSEPLPVNQERIDNPVARDRTMSERMEIFNCSRYRFSLDQMKCYQQHVDRLIPINGAITPPTPR